jgi:hypothetical protein
MMTPATTNFLHALARIAWFENVGLPAPAGFDARVLHSWDDVFDAERVFCWENVCLRAEGELTRYLCDFHMERYRRWNDLVDEVGPSIAASVNPACKALAKTSALSADSLAAMTWSTCVSACMEYEYADLRPIGFFHRLAQLILLGRCPCGFQGEYPDGILEIY